MSILLRFEAFESRVISYYRPRGTLGGLHALRLRRCFQTAAFPREEYAKHPGKAGEDSGIGTRQEYRREGDVKVPEVGDVAGQESGNATTREIKQEAENAVNANLGILDARTLPPRPQRSRIPFHAAQYDESDAARRVRALQDRRRTVGKTLSSPFPPQEIPEGQKDESWLSLQGLHDTGGNMDIILSSPGHMSIFNKSEEPDNSTQRQSAPMYTALDWKFPHGPPADLCTVLAPIHGLRQEMDFKLLTEGPPLKLYKVLKSQFPKLPPRVYHALLAQYFNDSKEELAQVLEDATVVNISQKPVAQSKNANVINAEKFDKHLALIYEALRSQDPHNLLYVFVQSVSLGRQTGKMGVVELLQVIPAESFSEVLRLLHPKHFIRRYGRLHEELNRQMMVKMGLPDPHKSGFLRFCSRLMVQIYEILAARSGSKLSLPDYAFLLKCARETGNLRAAEQIWRHMRDNKISPDACCYNDMLATKCWVERLNPNLNFHLRVFPNGIVPRTWRPENRRPYKYRGHLLSNTPQGDDGLDIKSSSTAIFQEMVAVGVSGNEETFCLMMTALARAGDLAGVESILKRVWGIDVSSLLINDESVSLPLKQYRPDSPIYPSRALLWTIAHIYGINNNVPTALRLVDYISRNYNIPIGVHIWRELLKWTFVLATKRKRCEKTNRPGDDIGKLPAQAPANLWATMTSPPYNVKPTRAMYNHMIKGLLRRHCYGEAQSVVHEYYNLHVKNARKLTRTLVQAQRFHRFFKHRNPGFKNFLSSPQRDTVYTQLEVRRSRLYIKEWLRILIWNGAKSLRNWRPEFVNRNIPLILEKYALFIPRRVEYRTSTGLVEFETDVVRSNTAAQERTQKRQRFYLERKAREQVLEGEGSWLQRVLGRDKDVVTMGLLATFWDKHEHKDEEQHEEKDERKDEVTQGG